MPSCDGPRSMDTTTVDGQNPSDPRGCTHLNSKRRREMRAWNMGGRETEANVMLRIGHVSLPARAWPQSRPSHLAAAVPQSRPSHAPRRSRKRRRSRPTWRARGPNSQSTGDIWHPRFLVSPPLRRRGRSELRQYPTSHAPSPRVRPPL